MVPIGATIGVLISMKLLSKGRLLCFIAMDVLVILGSLLTFVPNIAILCLGRFLLGLGGCGFASVIAPTFIGETALTKYKGPLVVFTQFNVMFGILFAYVIGYWAPNAETPLEVT